MNSDINNLPTLPEFIIMTIATILILVIVYKLLKREDDKVKKKSN